MSNRSLLSQAVGVAAVLTCVLAGTCGILFAGLAVAR